MFTSKFLVDERRNNALMLRITYNRKNAFMSLGLQISKEALENAQTHKPRPENLRYRSLLTQWQSIIEDVKIGLLKENKTNHEDVQQIKTLVYCALFGKSKIKQTQNLPETNCAPRENTGNFRQFYIARANSFEKRSTRESYDYTLGILDASNI